MTNELVLAPIPPENREGKSVALTPAQAILRGMALDSVQSPHTRRNYAKALDDLFAFSASQPLSRSLLMAWRAGMESLSPSTINVRLSAVRKMVDEARRAGMVGQEEAASLPRRYGASVRRAALDRHHSLQIEGPAGRRVCLERRYPTDRSIRIQRDTPCAKQVAGAVAERRSDCIVVGWHRLILH